MADGKKIASGMMAPWTIDMLGMPADILYTLSQLPTMGYNIARHKLTGQLPDDLPKREDIPLTGDWIGKKIGAPVGDPEFETARLASGVGGMMAAPVASKIAQNVKANPGLMSGPSPGSFAAQRGAINPGARGMFEALSPVDKKGNPVSSPGFTLDAQGKPAPAGFAVAIEPRHDLVTKYPELQQNPRMIDKWLREKEAILSRPNVYTGGWHDTNTGDVFLAPTAVVPNKTQALVLAEAVPNQRPVGENQRAIFDLNTFNEIPLKVPKGLSTPKGQEFLERVQSPEVKSRMNQAFEKGDRLAKVTYAKDDPKAEYWNLDNTEVQDVWGRDTPMWGQVLGATAARTQMPANVAVTQKFMARRARGEPMISTAPGATNSYAGDKAVADIEAGRYFDKNPMTGARPKITEMMLAPEADAPVIDTERIAVGLLGYPAENTVAPTRAEHWAFRPEVAKLGAETGLSSKEALARVWLGLAEKFNDTPADTFSQRIDKIMDMTPYMLKKNYEPYIGPAYKQMFGKDISGKLTREEVKALMRKGAVWGAGGAGVGLMGAEGISAPVD